MLLNQDHQSGSLFFIKTVSRHSSSTSELVVCSDKIDQVSPAQENSLNSSEGADSTASIPPFKPLTHMPTNHRRFSRRGKWFPHVLRGGETTYRYYPRYKASMEYELPGRWYSSRHLYSIAWKGIFRKFPLLVKKLDLTASYVNRFSLDAMYRASYHKRFKSAIAPVAGNWGDSGLRSTRSRWLLTTNDLHKRNLIKANLLLRPRVGRGLRRPSRALVKLRRCSNRFLRLRSSIRVKGQLNDLRNKKFVPSPKLLKHAKSAISSRKFLTEEAIKLLKKEAKKEAKKNKKNKRRKKGTKGLFVLKFSPQGLMQIYKAARSVQDYICRTLWCRRITRTHRVRLKFKLIDRSKYLRRFKSTLFKTKGLLVERPKNGINVSPFLSSAGVLPHKNFLKRCGIRSTNLLPAITFYNLYKDRPYSTSSWSWVVSFRGTTRKLLTQSVSRVDIIAWYKSPHLISSNTPGGSFFSQKIWMSPFHSSSVLHSCSLQCNLRRYPDASLKLLMFMRHGQFLPTSTLALNYAREKFFPVIRERVPGTPIFFLSLGLFFKFFSKSRAVIKTKMMYLILAGMLRKVLWFSGFRRMVFVCRGQPIYLQEIMSTIYRPATTIYKNPFGPKIIDEREMELDLKFPYMFFTHNKPYGPVKRKKRGRLKRKITKKLKLINRIED